MHSGDIKGSYHFAVSWNLLYLYMKKYLDNSLTFDATCRTIWQHELIHAMDHCSIRTARRWCTSGDLKKLWKYYWLCYRQEGIAELYYLCKGHSEIKNLEMAREQIQLGFERLARINPAELTKQNDIVKIILNTPGFYSAGPWMILHVLSCSRENEIVDLALSVAKRIENSEVIEVAGYEPAAGLCIGSEQSGISYWNI